MAALLTLDPQWLKNEKFNPTDIRGCVVIDGVALDLDHAAERPPLLLDMYQEAFGTQQNWHAASPMTWIAGKHPPFLVLIGAKDNWISHVDTEKFAAALKSSGTPVESVEIPDRDHFGMVIRIGERGDPVGAKIAEFIRKTSMVN